MLHALIVGFDGLAETIGAIFVKELRNDGDGLVSLGFGCNLSDIDDNLSVEDLLLDALIEVVGYGPDEDPFSPLQVFILLVRERHPFDLLGDGYSVRT